MIIVILCGGSGTRLWPLSTHNHPKQLVEIAGMTSPLRAAFDRAKLVTDQVYLLPEKRLITKIKDQIPELEDDHIINEPGLRGTANCILAAVDALERKGKFDEPITFITADHFIRDMEGFKRTIEQAGVISEANNCITLIGPEPTYPATIFGYIKKGSPLNEQGNAYRVEEFKEKPEFDTAKKFVQSGRYLWNCSYFVASGRVFADTIQAFAPNLYEDFQKLRSISETSSQEYIDTYLSFKNEAIDYALMEKASNLLVLPAAFDWADIGSFTDAHTVSIHDTEGNYIKGDNIHTIEVENSYIRNEEEKPIAVIGLDNVVVVNTPQGLLVSRKDISHKVGEIAKKIQASESDIS